MHSSKSQLKHQTPASWHSMKGISIAEHAILGFLADLAIPVGVRCWFSCPREYAHWEILHRGVRQKQFDNSPSACIVPAGTQRTRSGPLGLTLWLNWGHFSHRHWPSQCGLGTKSYSVGPGPPMGKGTQFPESLITHNSTAPMMPMVYSQR